MTFNSAVQFSQSALNWMQDVLNERFGHPFSIDLKSDGALVLRCSAGAQYIELASDSAAFPRADSDLPCSLWSATPEGWHTALPGRLCAPGAAHLPSPLIEAIPQGYRIHYNILGLVYWMLTRQEEIGRTDLDAHQRFPAISSHAYKHGYLERPIVDEWLHVLGQVIARTWPTLMLKPHIFSMKVSHDVDAPCRYGFRSWRGIAGVIRDDALKGGNIANLLRAPLIRLASRATLSPLDAYNTFDWIMDVSEQHGLKSAFYFICGRSSMLDAGYEPEHPAIRDLMRRIHSRGHEIGLHPSYGSYQKPEVIRAEADRLRRIAHQEGIIQTGWGGRMHYLRWQHATTLRAWEDAGMQYDSTLGYADRPGFRCGTCFEYPAFDSITQQSLSLRIRPLIVMECTIMGPGYMRLGTGEKAQDKLLQLKNACRAVNGCFTLLWHNSQFETTAKRTLYQTALL